MKLAKQSRPPSDDIINLADAGTKTRMYLESWKELGTIQAAADRHGVVPSTISNMKFMLLKRRGLKDERNKHHESRIREDSGFWASDLAAKFLRVRL